MIVPLVHDRGVHGRSRPPPPATPAAVGIVVAAQHTAKNRAQSHDPNADDRGRGQIQKEEHANLFPPAQDRVTMHGVLVTPARRFPGSNLANEWRRVRTCVRDYSRPPTRMRRAIRLGSVEVALLAAGELNHVGLDDALGLCLLLRGDPRYEPAARRWLVRLLTEHRDVPLADRRQSCGRVHRFGGSHGGGPRAVGGAQGSRSVFSPRLLERWFHPVWRALDWPRSWREEGQPTGIPISGALDISIPSSPWRGSLSLSVRWVSTSSVTTTFRLAPTNALIIYGLFTKCTFMLEKEALHLPTSGDRQAREKSCVRSAPTRGHSPKQVE